MATINFLYRSKKNEATLLLRLLFSIEKKAFVIGAKTKISVSANYWKKQHKLQRVKDVAVLNQQNQINNEINRLTNHVLSEFDTLSETEVLKVVNKAWLQEKVEKYYDSSLNKNQQKSIPTDLIGYIDFYLDYRKNEIAKPLKRTYIATRKFINKLQQNRQKTILIKEINEDFKNEFVEFGIANNYAKNSIEQYFRIVKIYCRHARYLGLEVHPQMDNLRLDKEKVEHIYLTFDELERIEKLNTNELPPDIETARLWLLISCFLGQRVSDFMRFTSDMIRYEDGKPLLEFTQTKTSKTMTIPIHPKVMQLIEKHGGNFPNPQTTKKYNSLIKEVCKLAQINQITKGGKMVLTGSQGKKSIKQTDQYPKYELVSSHIGRRSFATNFYGKIPTSFLIYITGHSSEQIFLTYIGKSNKDLAKEIFNFF